MNQTYKTQTIAGRELTLTVGQTYLATRPMARRNMTTYPVTIQAIMQSGNEIKVRELKGMSYDAANDFINAFNNGESSWAGRVW